MAIGKERAAQSFWESLNMKVRINSLLFDFQLNDNFEPLLMKETQEKHNHAAIEMQFILSGSGLLLVNDHEYRFAPYSIHIIGHNVFHAVIPDSQSPLNRFTLRFTFRRICDNDDWFPLTEAEQIKSLLSRLRYSGLYNKDNNESIFRLIQEIRNELKTPSLGSYANAQSLFAQVIVRTVREIVRDSDANTTYAMPSKAKDYQRPSIIDQFFSNYRQQLTLEMLAEQLNLSTRQVNRLLKQHYNVSFKQKLLSTRIEVAKDFLRTSDLPIEHIAREIGCESPPHFYCIFQDKTGMTPSEYRTMMRSARKSVARSL